MLNLNIESLKELNEDRVNCFKCEIAYYCKQKVLGSYNKKNYLDIL